MPIRTEAQARADLERHLDPLNDLFTAAHQEFRDKAQGIAHSLTMSARAIVYRDLILKQARAYADGGANGAHLHRKSQLLLLGLENRYLLRVKKLRQGFTVAVSPTRAAGHYDGNRLPDYATDMFPGCEDATLLYLGWMIPENAPDEIARFLVCNDTDRTLLWAIPLGEGKTAPPEQQELPMVGGPSDAPVKIRIKAAGQKKANG